MDVEFFFFVFFKAVLLKRELEKMLKIDTNILSTLSY